MSEIIRVPYEIDGRAFEGAIVFNGDASPRPAIFMQPDWTGVSQIMLETAAALAGEDHLVMIADMFGAGYGAKPKVFDELMAGMLAVHNDLPFTLRGGKAAHEALLAAAGERGLVDEDGGMLGVGYCAGGGLLLEQARAGQAFDALGVLHVTNPNPVVPGTPCNIGGRVIIIHGASDPVTGPDAIRALEAELTEAGVEWQSTMFGNGEHAFCVPKDVPIPGVKYDERLCRTSYTLLRDFFAR